MQREWNTFGDVWIRQQAVWGLAASGRARNGSTSVGNSAEHARNACLRAFLGIPLFLSILSCAAPDGPKSAGWLMSAEPKLALSGSVVLASVLLDLLPAADGRSF